MQKQLYKLFVELEDITLSAVVDSDKVLDEIVKANAKSAIWVVVPGKTNKIAFNPGDVVSAEVAEIDMDAYNKFGLVEVKDR